MTKARQMEIKAAAESRPAGRRLFKGRMRQRRWRRTNRLVDGKNRAARENTAREKPI